ncbi:transposase, partial [Listeria monocytogenes]|uniref:IS3 family transposase n=2 Tax=Listeriaceae TaxID=186820 RepID=UPI001F11778C
YDSWYFQKFLLQAFKSDCFQKKRADQLLDQRVLRLYQENRGIYGAGKLRYLLASSYLEYPDISIKRVQKSMRRQNLRSITVE